MKRIKGKRRENEWEISVRVTAHERLLTLGNEQGVVEGEVGGCLLYTSDAADDVSWV